ncbi:MAG: hypothetical protein LBQ63_00575 [Deltaproteobacteria bacterium]|nr:hypothetical protein [Deltaproteobacteria bacterium]
MPKLRFAKISPGGNPTLLLEAGQVEAPRRAATAVALMSPLHLRAEQAGFVDWQSPSPRLEMMGGEFCLNAVRALAYEMLRRGRFLPLRGSEDLFALAQCSGLPGTVQVRVRENAGENAAECHVLLRLEPAGQSLIPLEEGLVLARLPGIAHLLLDEEKHPPETDFAEEAARLLERFHLLLMHEPACGIIRHRPCPPRILLEKGLGAGEGLSITPLVHVAATGSYVRESACGSGSLALALALARSRGDSALLLHVLQPSGEFLRLFLDFSRPGLCLAEVGGRVSLIAEGETAPAM